MKHQMDRLTERHLPGVQGIQILGKVEWVRGDAMRTADVVAAAQGVSVVVHAANPAGYRNWKGLALPMLESDDGRERATMNSTSHSSRGCGS